MRDKERIMSFFVDNGKMEKLSGRSRQAIQQARNDGRLPYETKGSSALYDIEDPVVANYIRTHPASLPAAKKRAAREYCEVFMTMRLDGDVTCAMTGELEKGVKKEDITNLLAKTQDDELDSLKKREEIRKLAHSADTLELKKQVLGGDLIEREFVNRWVTQYLGTLHTQVLDFGGNGVCDELFSVANRLKGREATSEMEKVLSKGLSQLIKDAMDSMQKNPL